ncbi:MAG TPA: DUF4199 domain-containing protein [Pyrinomonadaceae bacterium]|jgi:hypothetical protein
MTKIVLTFGLISGVVVTILMWLMLTMMKAGAVNEDHSSELWGYATMVIALSLVFFGVKSYRDKNGGKISFLKGLQVGILISLISAVCYGVSWEVYYRTSGGNFMAEYTIHYIERMKQSGASDAEVAQTQADMDKFGELYKNFFVRFGMTLVEILPVGIIVTLLSAALLRRREVLPATPA